MAVLFSAFSRADASREMQPRMQRCRNSCTMQCMICTMIFIVYSTVHAQLHTHSRKNSSYSLQRSTCIALLYNVQSTSVDPSTQDVGLMGVKLMADGSAGAEDRPSLRPLIRFHSTHPRWARETPYFFRQYHTLGLTSGDLIFLKTMPYYLRPYHNKSHSLTS